MKRTYLKPAMEAIQTLTNQMMTGSIETIDDEFNPNKPILSRGRRGVWGDLWDDEIED